MQLVWKNIYMPFLGMFCFSLVDNLRGAYFPEILKDLNVNSTEGSFFLVVPFLCSVIGGQIVPIGMKCWPAGVWWRLGVAFQAVGCVCFVWAQNFTDLLVYSIFLGLGMGMISVSHYVVIREGAPERSLRRLFSGLQSCFAAGSVATPVLATFFISQQLHWKWAFVCVGLVSLALFLISCGLKFSNDHHDSLSHARGNTYKAKHLRQLMYVALMVSCYLGSELSFVARIVQYMEIEQGYSLQMSQYYLMAFAIGFFMSRLLFTWYPFPHVSLKNLLLFLIASSGVVMWGGLYLVPELFIFLGFSMAPIVGVFMNYLMLVYRHLAAQAVAYAMGVGSIGMAAVHYLVGYLTDAVGIHWALHANIVLLAVSGLLVLGHESIFQQGFARIHAHERS